VNHQPVFIDTWGWLALGYRRDARHGEVKNYYQQLHDEGISIHSTDYILDEVITLLFRRENFQQAIRFMDAIFHEAEEGNLHIERINSRRFAAAWQLRKQFADKPDISFTDLVSMSLMDELGINLVLTEDVHFLKVGRNFQLVP